MSSISLPSGSDLLISKIETRTARVGVIGLGYVGLPLTLLFSEQGFRVTGFDIDCQKVEKLSAGSSYIVRIPATEIQAATKKGFQATTDFSRISEMDAVIICVPTPLDDHHEPDTSFIEATAKSIAPHLRPGQLVVLESTTYPGTTEELLVPVLENNARGIKAARGKEIADNEFYVAFSPEREDPGNDTVARRDIPKVVGGLNAKATELASALYSSIFNRAVSVSTPAVAEMTKLLENIYRCVNIALVNELKMVYSAMGIDIWEVVNAAKTKPFGFMPFYPGPGLGGHCIPIDPFYLTWKAREYGQNTRFIELAGEVNTSMPDYVIHRVGAALNAQRKALNGSKILILGLAYKPNVDDDRESPSYVLMDKLRESGAEVVYYDPHVPVIRHTREHPHWAGTHSVVWNREMVQSCDAVLIATHHQAVNYQELADWSSCIIDTRNIMAGVSTKPGQVWKA